jgi:outer membrane protein assembly factor BamB/tetratricopeptide (TPR) repeat protein
MASSNRAGSQLVGHLVLAAVLIALPAAGLAVDGQTVEVQKARAVQAAPAQAIGKAMPVPPPPPTTEGQFTDAITLPSDRKIKKLLQLAEEDSIKNKAWSEAARLLQSILDNPQDVFVQVRRKGQDNQEKVRWVSAKTEANRLIGTMPAEGLETYEVEYGGRAGSLLAEARKKYDAHLLAEVAQRYFHTRAGAEATDLLGTYALDRGQPMDAALRYRRLFQRTNPDGLAPVTLFKAALAFHRTGDPTFAAEADRAWKILAAKVGRDGLTLGDETLALGDLRKELDRFGRPAVYASNNWTERGGNASRSARGQGSAPFLESKWRRSMLDEGLSSEDEKGDTQAAEERRQLILSTLRQQHYHPELMIPAFYPIATGGKVVYRSYRGITAINLQTGELIWSSFPTVASLDGLLRSEGNRKQEVMTWIQTYTHTGWQNLIFENSMVGGLSTDNIRVYAVDDMAVPPHPSAVAMGPFGMAGGPAVSSALADVANHSRLVAFDLESGKIAWEHPDPQKESTDTEKDLAGSFYLGPPLPLGGKLYVLTEKNSELRLVCLDPANEGKLIWAQTLATARNRLLLDVSRRVHAVELAYSEGILVCPTNAGAVLGMDLLTRSLVWAFPYREKGSDQPDEQQQQMFIGRRRFMGGMDPSANLGNLSGEWKMAGPVVQDGKVVFTAPDGNNGIHCINLIDGDPLWQAERHDDVYLGGVYDGVVVLVGKNFTRGLRLADGKELWKVETGAPSGQGVASGSFYYLPLKKGEVAKIDLTRGKLMASSPSPKNEVPGNLIFYEGDVISQTESAVTCYPQVEYKEAQITALLQKNPHDPEALKSRGELRLYRGDDLAGAVADLHEAQKYHPSETIRPQIRAKLYQTLTEWLQRDFGAAETYLPEYKELCDVPVPAEATASERQKLADEQRRRQANYLALVALGRERQGRLVDAFQAYLDFGALAQSKELVSIFNEPGLVQPGVWAQGHIAGMVARATPEQRKPLEEEIARRWTAVRAARDLEALRKFVDAFGSLFSAGREARLMLGERYLTAGSFIEAEQQLQQLRAQTDDVVIAGRATEALARLMTRKGLLEDAAHFYHLLARDFAHVVIRDGKTGADFLNDLTTDKRFLPYLDESVSPFLGVTPRVILLPGRSSYPQQTFSYEAHGDALPFYRHYRLVWSPQHAGNNLITYQFKLLDRDSSETVWSVNSSASRATYLPNMAGNAPFPFFARGHLVILYVGHTICALDLIDHKKLWEYDLVPPERLNLEQPYSLPQLTFDKEGVLHLVNQQNKMDMLGQIGPVSSSYVCLRLPDRLTALDPVSGTALWTKTDVTPNTRVFGDEQFVYLIDAGGNRRASSARALRGRDGNPVEVNDFSSAYQHHQRILDGRLLVSDKNSAGNLVVRLYDIGAGKDVWKQVLAPDAILLHADDPDLTAYVEPDGKLSVFDLGTLQQVFTAEVKAEHLKDVKDGLLLRDARQYYAFLKRKSDINQNIQGPWSNVFGLRTEAVNGWVYAFLRPSGKLGWRADVPDQFVLLEQFEELPMVLFTARYNRALRGQLGLPNNNFTPVSATIIFDKRTGKRIDPEELADYSNRPRTFNELRIDRRAGTVDLIGPNMVLRHAVGEASGRQDTAGLNSALSPASTLPGLR